MATPSDGFSDLRGRSYERLDLTGAEMRRVRLDDARLQRVVFSGATLRGGYAERARFIGVELYDVEITGDVQNLTINGIEVSAFVNAELDRREPERIAMRPTDPDGFRAAWVRLEELWAGTVERASQRPPAQLHASVAGEWSFIQTLRHLSFATASWLHRGVLAEPSPWHPLDLPWEEAPGWDGVPWDREARPPLAEVLAVRETRVADVRRYLSTLTAEELGRRITPPDDGVSWPPAGVEVAECLRIILNEEWEHRRYAERDLAALDAG